MQCEVWRGVKMEASREIPVLLTCMLLAVFSTTATANNNAAMHYQWVDQIPQNTHVGNIVADTHLDLNFTSDVLDSFRYGMLTDQYKDYFAVDTNRGDLRTIALVDRDMLCPRQPHCVLNINVGVVRPQQYFQIFKVIITLTDTNDNSPVFAEVLTTVRISENALPGVSFLLPSAHDPDSGSFGVQEYNLRTPSPKFGLQTLNNLDGSKDVRLELKQRLNREQQGFYSLEIEAKDGGVPANTGTLVVEVVVMDANDNSPTFQQNLYNVSVPENTRHPFLVTTVRATDPDEGQNGVIQYKFTPKTKNLFGSAFKIDNETGDIILIQELDYETLTVYHLLVMAEDLGPDSVPAHTKVSIYVEDVNDYSPHISINSWSTDKVVEVRENQPPGEFVAHVAVEDLDKGPSGQVHCDIPEPQFELRMYAGAYKVLTGVSFDRETTPQLTFTLRCRDNGSPPLSTTQGVTVMVLDANDHTPSFARGGRYTTSVQETAPVGSPVIKVNATDADSGKNAAISYHLHANSRNLLRIDPGTGLIITNAKFDHETMSEFIFSVLAIDDGAPSRSATATVTLQIGDANDESPKFTQISYNFGTFENQASGTEIGTLAATDLDSHPYDDFLFSMKADNGLQSNTFKIDPDSGKITTLKNLDREYQAAYYLVVTATNTAHPKPSSSVSVTVYVADRNDNAPRIQFPSLENNSIDISSFSPVNYIVTKVVANDLDLGSNSNLNYIIAKGNEDEHFTIDSNSGFISVARELVNTRRLDFQLMIQVKDEGEPEKSAVATLHVHINTSVVFALQKDIKHKLLGTAESKSGLGYHQKILIILGAVTAVLVMVLVSAIVCIKKRQRHQDKDNYKYMYRVDLSPKHQPSGVASGSVKVDTQFNAVPQGSPAHKPNDTKKMVSFDIIEGDYPDTFPDISGTGFRADPSMQRLAEGTDPPPRPPKGRSSAHDPGAGPDPTPAHRESIPQQLLHERHLEVQHILDLLKNQDHDSDSTSGCSADMSNSDSGRGPSEEGGDHRHVMHGSCDHPGHKHCPSHHHHHHHHQRPYVACPLKSCGLSHLPPIRVGGKATTSMSDTCSHGYQPGSHSNTGEQGQHVHQCTDKAMKEDKNKSQADRIYPHQPLEMKTFGYGSGKKDFGSQSNNRVANENSCSDGSSHVVLMENMTSSAVDV